jgi:hypothetical protein
VRPPPGPELYLPPQFREDGYLVDSVVVEESEGKEVRKGEDVEEGGQDDMIGATRWQKAARRKKMVEESEAAKAQKLTLETEANEGNTRKDSTVSTKEEEEKPLSRAERRRRIKEQILAEGEGEGFKGYRRRTW